MERIYKYLTVENLTIAFIVANIGFACRAIFLLITNTDALLIPLLMLALHALNIAYSIEVLNNKKVRDKYDEIMGEYDQALSVAINKLIIMTAAGEKYKTWSRTYKETQKEFEDASSA